MCPFLSLSLRITPRIALMQRFFTISSLHVSPDLRVQVLDAYVAMDTIRALYMRIFRALLIDLFYQMVSFSRPNTVDASLIHLITYLVLFGTTLPRNTNYSRCSTSFPSMTIRSSLGEIMLHLAPFIFIPYFLGGRWSFSKIADRRVVSYACLMSIDKLTLSLGVISRLFSSFMTNSKKILNRVGEKQASLSKAYLHCEPLS